MRPTRSRRFRLAGALLLSAAALACSPGPRPIEAGRDSCALCNMGIAEPRFAAELVTRTGQIRTFDSIECMVGYLEYETDAAEIRSSWVSDHDRPERLIAADSAWFLQSPSIRSPMGLGFAAFVSRTARDDAQAELGGVALAWDDVRRVIRDAWPNGAPHRAAHGAAGAVRTGPALAEGWLGEAVRNAEAGARIVVPAGVWREPTLHIDKPLELVGEPGAVLDGGGERQILIVRANDVTIRGLVLRSTGISHVEDRAAIRFENVSGCRVEDNRVEDAFFGIYLAGANHCVVRGNTIVSAAERQTAAGNGIHAWHSKALTIEDNRIRGHRDGIYFEFVDDSRVSRNISTGNLRYGLHFMFSNRNRYERNTFRRNGTGVAVMYASQVDMVGNMFLENWGPATFGLLLKDIRDSRLDGNTFRRNSVALYAEGSDRLVVQGNTFHENGWAVKLMANSDGCRFEANDFRSNSFDVATNSRRTTSRFSGNYWDAYRGYDLDRDGVGDSPFRPVRLFSLIVEQNGPSLILLRSMLVQVLDAAEALLPSLTPAALVDDAPRMSPLHTARLAHERSTRP